MKISGTTRVFMVLGDPVAQVQAPAAAALADTRDPAAAIPDYLEFFGLPDAARAVRDDFPDLRALMQPQ